MKILIATGIFPPDIGGPATYVPAIARGLCSIGNQVRVITTSEPEGNTRIDKEFPFDVIRVNRRQKYSKRTLELMSRISREARKSDLILANGLFLETSLSSCDVRRPLIFKIVGDDAWERSINRGWTKDTFREFQSRMQGPAATANTVIRSWCVRRADRIIVPSNFLKRIVKGWGVSPSRCRVIYNGVDVAERKAVRPPVSNSGNSGRFRVLTAGRLTKWKRIDAIISAIRSLPEASLTVVGGGPCKQELLDHAVHLDVSNRVTFTGPLEQGALHRTMMDHDAFVLASSYEGLPHVIVEAMKVGIPVVACPSGGTIEIVSHGATGLICQQDPEAISLAFRVLIDNPELRLRLIDSARRFVDDRFTFTAMLQGTQELLHEVMRSSMR